MGAISRDKFLHNFRREKFSRFGTNEHELESLRKEPPPPRLSQCRLELSRARFGIDMRKDILYLGSRVGALVATAMRPVELSRGIMSQIAQTYTTQVHNHFKTLHANWPVNAPVRLGDFGYLTEGVFKRKSNLTTAFGTTFSVREVKDFAAHYFFASSNAVDVQIQGAGKAGDPMTSVGNGSLAIRFSKENGVFLNAADCVMREIEDQVELGEKILELFEKGHWIDDWFVVTSVVASKRTTMLVSGAAGADVVLDVEGGTSVIDLADGNLRLALRSQKRMGFTAVAQEALVPLLGLSKVRKRLLGKPVFVMRGTDDADSLELRRKLIEERKAIPDFFEFTRHYD